MILTVNGNQVEVPAGIKTVIDLLQHFELNQRVVIVERNNTILEKPKHGETFLSQGDKIELIHFVGGG